MSKRTCKHYFPTGMSFVHLMKFDMLCVLTIEYQTRKQNDG